MKAKTENLGYQLYATIPLSVMEHYADKEQVSKVDLCIDIVSRNTEWAERLFDEDNHTRLEDRIHDFVGLIDNDLHFLPRI